MDNDLKYTPLIIKELKTLKSVSAPAEFKDRLYDKLMPPKKSYSFFPLVVRIAAIILSLFILSGTGLVLASAHSEKGDILFPIKQAVEGIRQTIKKEPVKKQENSTILPSVTPSTSTVSLTPSPIVKSQNIEPTPTTTVLPTISQTPIVAPQAQGEIIPTQTQADVNVLGVGVSVSTPTSITPEPTKTIDLPIVPPVQVDLSLGDKPLLKLGL